MRQSSRLAPTIRQVSTSTSSQIFRQATRSMACDMIIPQPSPWEYICPFTQEFHAQKSAPSDIPSASIMRRLYAQGSIPEASQLTASTLQQFNESKTRSPTTETTEQRARPVQRARMYGYEPMLEGMPDLGMLETFRRAKQLKKAAREQAAVVQDSQLVPDAAEESWRVCMSYLISRTHR
ncbi:hypothetical protein D6D01_02703 [Aureobasidium pullulans]|uniref:Uncharacterized protein n=1 Tax=Aureobasidium pullulans TaxID=5580 RepID=A0A4S9LQX8_AURPU|nr:hypothetical protein D6D01_02703 [Aureobasidium pullulans]